MQLNVLLLSYNFWWFCAVSFEIIDPKCFITIILKLLKSCKSDLIFWIPRYRLNEEKADWIIYVTDVGQQQHFDMVFSVCITLLLTQYFATNSSTFD